MNGANRNRDNTGPNHLILALIVALATTAYAQNTDARYAEAADHLFSGAFQTESLRS